MLTTERDLRSLCKTKNINPCEKLFLRKAIGLTMPGLLPDSILYRTKEAFSDGVSGNQGSWFQIIQNKLQDMTFPETLYRHNPPVTNEQKYYRTIYDKLYPNTATVIPYFWMPKYVKANDCSARTLDIYTIQIEEEENKTTSSNNLFTKLLGGT